MGYGNEEMFLTPKEREALVRSFLGKTVDVVIDRPIGYVHEVKGITLHYTVNYGYIPGVTGGDGEEQDVYVLGVTEPLTRFRGRIIGAILREDDNEDKLVAAPEGVELHQAQIMDATWFVEQYFRSSVRALCSRSCGIIPYREAGDTLEYLLLLQSNGCWSFPKGHMDRGESELKTALRELWEETGLRAFPETDFRTVVTYRMSPISRKEVVLFLAQTEGEFRPAANEIRAHRWATLAQARSLLQKENISALEQAENWLRKA